MEKIILFDRVIGKSQFRAILEGGRENKKSNVNSVSGSGFLLC